MIEEKKKAFCWAHNLAKKLGKLPKFQLAGNLDDFVQEFEVTFALFQDVKGYTLLACYDQNKAGFYFWEVIDFSSAKARNPELVDLLLRNGQYLYFILTGDRKIQVVK